MNYGGFLNVFERANQDCDSELERLEVQNEPWPDQVYLNENGEMCERPAACDYLLGNREFPVARSRELIVETVINNPFTIVTARTGGGKSTNIPQFLFESGYFSRIVETQPRIVAAREVSRYVSDMIGDSIQNQNHNLVGYKTASEGRNSEDSAILNVTDGLQLMHEVSGDGIKSDEVLVIDEFHERNSNMDALLAIAINNGIRVVVTSATLDAQKLQARYSKVLGQEVPIIDIPGAIHEIVERESGDLDKEVVEAAKRTDDVLSFLPGRKEIGSTLSRVSRRTSDSYSLLTLHGDQTPEEQSRVFPLLPDGKIVFSTSVGQTSITIDGIDVVVDCGFERTMILDKDGVATLATQSSSRATSDQRRGRIGRTKPGMYIRAQLKDYPQLQPLDELDSYDVPEIQRIRTENLQLKLAAFGHSFDSLPFFDKPSDIEIARGGERLVQLGLFRKLGKSALDGYAITPDGEKAAHIPLDVYSAKMVIESRKYGSDVELQMMAAAAVQQIKGITMTASGMDNWKSLTKETSSDIIAGIDFMVGAMLRTEAEQRSKHIVGTRFDKAMRSFQQLANKRNLDVCDLKSPSVEQREQLTRCIISGADELFTKSGQHGYLDSRRKKRRPVTSSVVQPDTEIIIGSSFNLQEVRRKKIVTHALVTSATNVTLELLQEVIPNRVTTSIDSFYVDKKGRGRTEEVVYFDGYSTGRRISRTAEPGIALQRFLINQIFSAKDIKTNLPPNIEKARSMIDDFKKLQHRTAEDLGIEYSVEQLIKQTIRETDYKSLSFDDIDPFIDLEAVSHIIPESIRAEIVEKSPDTVTIDNGGQTLTLTVDYLEGSNRAHVTVQSYFHHLLPFTIGERRLSVRTSTKSPYVNLERALESGSRPSRSDRRGGVNVADSKHSTIFPNVSNIDSYR